MVHQTGDSNPSCTPKRMQGRKWLPKSGGAIAPELNHLDEKWKKIIQLGKKS